MKIPFWKMHGAANDFILVDDREKTFPTEDQEWIASIASRRTGIGSDGLILIQPSGQADFHMRFFNPDGGEAEMCGNGARCVARLAHEIGVTNASMTFNTVAGIVKAQTEGKTVHIELTPPKDWVFNETLNLDGEALTFHAVNTGVPHVVIEVEDVEAVDISKIGTAVRFHDRFQPVGTNVNFITVTEPDALRVRTYERGVESETHACGTGIAACGLIAGKLNKVTVPAKVKTTSKYVLEVRFDMTEDGAANVILTGPAEHVFQGTLAYA